MYYLMSKQNIRPYIPVFDCTSYPSQLFVHAGEETVCCVPLLTVTDVKKNRSDNCAVTDSKKWGSYVQQSKLFQNA
jgi:hypothetical protein